ncbi:MAG: membrane protein [Rhodothermaceae bacterium]|nr:MAG: membrane protein [Rhodothermaceae bacterium]
MSSEPLQESPPVAPDQTRRLHPYTLVLRLIVSLPAFIILILPFLRNPDTEAWLNLVLAVVYGLVAIPWIVVYYRRFRYRLTPRELIIEYGVFTRKHRNIPVEKIQTVEIEQQLLARLLGLARVKVQTAGSATTEGVLEYVSLPEAHALRRIIRAYQRGASMPAGAPDPTASRPSDAAPPAERDVAAGSELLTLTTGRVLLSGAFRFSLLYIAVAFSLLQYLDPDPEALARWMTRGPLRALLAQASASPWLSGLAFVLTAALLSWLTGIAVNLARYYRFRLWLEPGKLHMRHGLFTLSENTIPVRKIQALILRTNPVMARFGWWEVKVQTMGFDPQEQGYQVIAPLVRMPEVEALTRPILPFVLPATFEPVSPRHARRVFVRLALGWGLLTAAVAFFWPPAGWALGAVPLLAGYAFLAWKHHAFAFDGTYLFVRRGVVRRHLWVIPVEKFQVFYLSGSLFQRRLGLRTTYVDTAGAAGLSAPRIVDLPVERAESLFAELYRRFQAAAPVAPMRSRSEQRPR